MLRPQRLAVQRLVTGVTADRRAEIWLSVATLNMFFHLSHPGRRKGVSSSTQCSPFSLPRFPPFFLDGVPPGNSGKRGRVNIALLNDIMPTLAFYFFVLAGGDGD